MRLREQTDEVTEITEVNRCAASDGLKVKLQYRRCDTGAFARRR